ncbi:RidA family protein [Actinoplanes solisilvae]|uniref:RidA family protein n=1 Tax=Actinoplanes solisilvae TaxID=2486853 RepID=UPI000FD74590|nr:RidA family protein [Actinoplanes solisilvae]
MQHHYVRPAGSPPTNGYSHAVAFTGTTVVVSGQVPLDAEGRLVGEDDAREQTRQVFRNISSALAAAGATMSDVVKLTIFLTNMADLPAFRQARDEFIDLEHPPASSLVQVAGLVNADFRVEIEAIAVVPAPSAG